MREFLLASTLILAVMAGWLYVQELYRRFSQAHPELGPFRPDAGGCGGGCCSCNSGSCDTTAREAQPRRAAPPDGASPMES